MVKNKEIINYHSGLQENASVLLHVIERVNSEAAYSTCFLSFVSINIIGTLLSLVEIRAAKFLNDAQH